MQRWLRCSVWRSRRGGGERRRSVKFHSHTTFTTARTHWHSATSAHHVCEVRVTVVGSVCVCVCVHTLYSTDSYSFHKQYNVIGE